MCATLPSFRMEQYPSALFSMVSLSTDNGNLEEICRICHTEEKPDLPLVSPCSCSGSMRYVHQSCLQQWIMSSGISCCELCNFRFIIHKTPKPFKKWGKFFMSPKERYCMFSCIIFLLFSIICVVWSLYVLYTITSEEIKQELLPIWIKLSFKAISLTVGLIFICIVCKHLFGRWRANNNNIYVQNAPEKRGMVQQQEMAVFSTEDTQLNAIAETSEENKRISSNEDEFLGCQSDSSSSGTINNYSNDAKNTYSEIPSAAKDAANSSLVFMTESGIMDDDHDHSLSDVVVSPKIQQVSSTSTENVCIFTPEKPSQ